MKSRKLDSKNSGIIKLPTTEGWPSGAGIKWERKGNILTLQLKCFKKTKARKFQLPKKI